MSPLILNVKEASDFRVTDPTKPVRIRLDPNDEVASNQPISIPTLMKRVADYYPHQNALMYKDSNDHWKAITYEEYRNRVVKIAKAFIKLGLKRHESVAILAANSVEWLITCLAAIHAG